MLRAETILGDLEHNMARASAGTQHQNRTATCHVRFHGLKSGETTVLHMGTDDTQ